MKRKDELAHILGWDTDIEVKSGKSVHVFDIANKSLKIGIDINKSTGADLINLIADGWDVLKFDSEQDLNSCTSKIMALIKQKRPH